MTSNKRINAPRSPTQEYRRIRNGSCQGSRNDSSQINNHNPPPPMHHFQRNPQHQLHEYIESNVRKSSVDKHISQKSPSLVPPIRIIDKYRIKWNRTCDPNPTIPLDEWDSVINKYTNFHTTYQDHK